MFGNLKKMRKYVLFLCDFLVWNLSFYTACAISLESFSLKNYETQFIHGILFVNISFSVIFLLFRLYDKIWRYASIEDFFYVGLASICSNFAFCVGTLAVSLHLGVRVYMLFAMITTFILLMFRALYRLDKIFETRIAAVSSGDQKSRMLLVGAGEAAALILNEFSKSSQKPYLPVCIVDDDPEKQGRSVAGVRVAGSTYEIAHICEKFEIDTILFTISGATVAEKKRILDACARTNLDVKILPNICKIIEGDQPLTERIRQVQVEDLLGREPVLLDAASCCGYIKGKVVMVTGGGGSIGGELCRQITKLSPSKLIILDNYENGAYEVQQELIAISKDFDIEVEMASIREFDKLEKVFVKQNVQVVFHAAAHKHVPLMEKNPEEAAKNNILGTKNLITLADKHRVETLVQISTDKAVNPTNVMGATKRVCELMVQLMDRRSNTHFVAVRFGNVLGSNGSVIPLFKRQIEEGGPVTVTHPEIIRYFMTIPEAVSLVLTAGGFAKGGEVFVLDMGDPVRIRDLAENLIRLSGFVPGKDIKVKYSGLRPGEKLFEELLIDKDTMQKTASDKIYVEPPQQIDEETFLQKVEEICDAAQKNDAEAVVNFLHELVPNFNHKK